MTDKKPDLLDVLGPLVLIVPLMLLDAWVVCTMWGWFVAPAFHLPTPSIAIMAGLTCTYTMVRTPWSPPKDVSFWKLLVSGMSRTGTIFAVGAIFHALA